MKRSLKILIIVLAVSTLLLPFNNVTHAGVVGAVAGAVTQVTLTSSGFYLLINSIGNVILEVSSVVLTLTGVLFDLVVKYTVVDMSTNLSVSGGIGASINGAWATLRDIANIAFIFVLLWAALQTILELNTSNFGKTIKNIIIIALVINFSLFFSKVLIDAGNIAAIGFYNSILAGAKANPVDLGLFKLEGISSVFMNATGMQGFWSGNALKVLVSNLTDPKVFISGMLGGILMLILSIILLVMSVMFIARYIILVFLMILSPLAFIGYTIPGMNSKFKEWWSALVNQSFFAAYFFLLLWVAIKIISQRDLLSLGTPDAWSLISMEPTKTIGLLLNYFIVIGFVIAALILSKKMATSTAGFAAVAGGIGAVTMGGVGLAGRQLGGRWGRATLNDTDLRERAARGDVGARMKLATANRFSKSSFDLRGVAETKLGKATGSKELFGAIGGASGKGGFAAAVDEKAKKKAEYSKNVYGQTAEEKVKAGELKPAYDKAKKIEDQKIKDEKEKIKKDIAEQERLKKEVLSLEEQKKIQVEIDRLKADLNKEDEERYSAEFKAKKAEYDKYDNAGKDRQKTFAKRIENGPLGIKFIGQMQGNREAVIKIREQVSGKSRDKRIVELLTEDAKASGDLGEPETPAAPPTSPAGGGASTGGTTTP